MDPSPRWHTRIDRAREWAARTPGRAGYSSRGVAPGPGRGAIRRRSPTSCPAWQVATIRITASQSRCTNWTGGPAGVGEVAVTPLGDCDQHRIEVDALVGEPVLVAGTLAGRLVRLLTQDLVLDEKREPVGEHLPGIEVCRRMSSKRRTPLNTSRSTTKVQRSPRIAIARPTVQLSTEKARAGGVRTPSRIVFTVTC